MLNLNIKEVESLSNTGSFSHFVKVGDLFVSSKVDSNEQISFIKSHGIESVVDLKSESESSFHDKEEFVKEGIDYYHFPISNLKDVSFDDLVEFDKKLKSINGKTLIYCMSGNRVGALMALYLSFITGHSKERAFHFGVNIGMTKDTLKTQILSLLTKENLE